LWWRQSLVVFTSSVGIAAAAAALFALVVPEITRVEVAGVVILGAGAVAFLRRPSLGKAIRMTDHVAALDNRLATALEILEGRMGGELAPLQLADAWQACRGVPPRRMLPTVTTTFRIALATALLMSVLAILAARALGTMPAWSDGLRSPVTTAHDDASSVADTPTILLESTVSDSPGPDETPAVTSARLREQLQERDARSRASESAVAKLADALKGTAAAQDVGRSLERTDYDQAADDLRNLARESDQLSSGARQELAHALLQTASETAALDQTLATAEQDAARALARGEYEGGRKALENLAAALTAQQGTVIPSPEIAKSLQQLQAQNITSPASFGSCGGGDEYNAEPIDCSAVGLYSTGAMRSVAHDSHAPSPSGANGEVGRGGGYATGGGATSPVGDGVTHLDAPDDNVVQVDLTPLSALGRGGTPDPKAATTILSQTVQKDVVLGGDPQPAQPIGDNAETTVVPPGQNQVVRDFFQVSRSPR
jgi:hypothetical protein